MIYCTGNCEDVQVSQWGHSSRPQCIWTYVWVLLTITQVYGAYRFHFSLPIPQSGKSEGILKWLNTVYSLLHNIEHVMFELHCTADNMCITIPGETKCFSLVLGCHSSIPMPGGRPQYGIPIPMTDKRASQVSHSSWRTKASHNKSKLIPRPWAPSTRKTKRWILLTKASY